MLDPVIHQPVRLQVLAALQRNRELSFVALRDMLDTTNGNLHAHGQVLEHAGYITIRRVLARSGFEVRYRLTESGALAFQDYARELQRLLDSPGAVATQDHVGGEAPLARSEPSSSSDESSAQKTG